MQKRGGTEHAHAFSSAGGVTFFGGPPATTRYLAHDKIDTASKTRSKQDQQLRFHPSSSGGYLRSSMPPEYDSIDEYAPLIFGPCAPESCTETNSGSKP